MRKAFLHTTLAILVSVVVLLVTVIVYEVYFVKDVTTTSVTEKNITKKEPIPLTQKTLPVQPAKPLKKVIEKTEVLSIATEIEDYVSSQQHKDDIPSKPLLKPSCKVIVPLPKKVQKTFSDHIPRLAIIMDDIGNANQVKHFKKIPFPVTPSLFPVTSKHTHTPEFAKHFNCYMVHMPMEAFHFARPEENTLQVSDSLEMIDQKIAAMHHDFPDAVAINNHTGSKFTSDASSMDKLFCVLDKYDITFIDSKTAPHTKGKETGKLHNKVVLERNVFLDNEPDVNYILGQLKKAVRYAKKHGVAIAICHPRPETFEAFQYAKKYLRGVKMVYIDALYD